jgi:hypothetical protein
MTDEGDANCYEPSPDPRSRAGHPLPQGERGILLRTFLSFDFKVLADPALQRFSQAADR